ncbi:hypothetical protein [Microbacterium sp. SS28]|uniref:hypothetical protein n=1 Tax=Microbacterium sp. SS28 TaxID=2919948 RepID=UPI001FAA0621|nr:hypothetical protein [Microbacterium sp. SS28]
MALGARASRWIAIAAIAVLAAGVGILAVLAYQHANPESDPEVAAPVPTFTLGVESPTPTPTPTPTPAAPPRETERFLAVGSQAMWRATAGLCGSVEPLVERSGDGGQTWSDVTARYLGLAQVASLDAFSARDAEMIAAAGDCTAQGLRTYTDGEFWAPFPEVLAASRYIDLTDPAVVHLGGGATTAAPCAQARGLRASGDTVALVCDARAWVWTGSAWSTLSATDVVALAVSNGAVLAAHSAPGCTGLTITRYAAAGTPDDPGTPVGCAEGTDAAPPAALAVAGGSVLLWSGGTFLAVSAD